MAFSSTVFRRTVIASAVTAAVAIGPVMSALAQVLTLSGAGATFPAPLYERYAAEFTKKNPNIRVNYQAIGSGGGINQTIAGTVDFGGSDAAMTDAQIAKVSRGVILVPTAGGAVAVVYNLPGVSNLKLSRAVLPEIFGGKITKWNDPKIVKDNPGVNLPNSPIRSVVRADGSGTTFIFVNHLSAISPYFKGRVGVSTAPKWTTNPIKGKGNAGVAAQVKRTVGGIGYVELSFAQQNKIPMAAVQNRQGKFIVPSVQAAEDALDTVQFPDNFRVFVGDPTDGYPIVGLTWIMVYKEYPKAKADAIEKLVSWILTDGQKINGSLGYTKIPASTAKRVINTVKNGVKGI
ncbi:phosphate ABC transporter substrate-binding protein [Neosynechococcus sphagnicola sy1]|uniref:Phosphate-binding protein n=1 Tax=Neosynechococcus sphagnicola sy1 TaxID=1497020 RepID=A0A098THY1_9CYAN|nr:phosphate ABC transporter substrate-binding protein PstS [Neosynechococcus sphagnicola]KGF72180.1 phosphate ABC transporter substrate-binding protein [Neosynechococcus sphagnicola sy1]